MTGFSPKTPRFAERVRASFSRQRVMETIGAELVTVEPGRVVIELPHRDDLTQQHGFLHAGIATTIADSAGGYAAFSLMPEESAVLAVEFKVNLLSPAKGTRFRAIGEVKRPGRRLTVSSIEVLAITDEETNKVVLTGLHTAICLPNSDGMHD